MTPPNDATSPRVATGEREAILARVRRALAEPTDPRVRHPATHSTGYSAVLPPVRPTVSDRLDVFRERAEALKASLICPPTVEAAAQTLAALADDFDWTRLAVHSHPLVEQATAGIRLPRLTTDRGYAPTDLEQCDAAVTACDALIAQTGSVLLTAASAGGRALSVLPPHHVVVATIDQLLPDLPAAYALLEERYRQDWPSFATFITGPSRTGDIERILVLGAHGPRQLTILLIGQP